jgi:methionyl-tRNA formyltransferase
VRVVFLGLPLAACLLAADGHEILLAALSRTDTPGRRRLRRTIGPDRVVDRPKLDARFVQKVRELAPDLVVSWFWTNKIPVAVPRAAALGGIGVHPSLLPRHRGPDPTTWAILSGDSETGVTCHRLEEEYDTGDVLAQEAIAIDPAWNAWELARALDRPSLRVLRAVCRRFAAGDPPPGIPQDDALATDAPFLDEEAERIVWDAPAAEVLRRIRALAPSPGAFTEIAGATVTVQRAAIVPAPAVLERPGEAGWLGEAAVVRTRDAAIRLDLVERDGAPVSPSDLEALLRPPAPSAPRDPCRST